MNGAFGSRGGFRISFAIFGVMALLAGVVFNFVYLYMQNNKLDDYNTRTATIIAELDGEIKATNERKAAEQARKEAEEKARRLIDPADIIVVVNKKRPIQPVYYIPSDLSVAYGATLSSKAIDSYVSMYSDALNAGQPFYVTSSYRSYGDQVVTYNHWVSVSGQQQADTYSARPGFSEHQTGFVIDVAAGGCALDCFGSTSQYQWLQENAANYGFVQRYYSGYEAVTGYRAEEWHYRYVGTEVALDMRLKGIKTLEEYFEVDGGDYHI